MRTACLLAGALVHSSTALKPCVTRRGLAGLATAAVAAPQLARAADVLEIPPATTKMGGLLEKFFDTNRGFRLMKPTTWNKFDGEPGAYDVRFVDVVSPSESVTLSTSAYGGGASIEDLAPVDKLGAKLAGADLRGALMMLGGRALLRVLIERFRLRACALCVTLHNS